MSLAEQMLATMPLSEESSTLLADEEGHIVINESRQAIVPNELKTIAVTGDKDIETITFDCVRYWDGYDLSTFAIYLNYVLPDMTTGTYIPKSITTSDGDKFYHFDWLIEKNITQKSGKISFAVTAVKTKQNESGETVVDKQWSSLPNGDCSIALGLNIENVPDNEETQDILSQMSAILEQIHADVDEWIETALVQDVGDSEDKAMSQKATTVAIENAKSYSTSYTDEKSRQLNASIEKNNQIANRNAKQIENLKAGISEQFETDSNVAYLKDVPQNALPYAAINEVGGMTYKDTSSNTLEQTSIESIKSIGSNILDISKLLLSDSEGLVIDVKNGIFKFKNISQNTTSGVKVNVFLTEGEYFISGSLVSSDGLPVGSAIYDIENSSWIVNNASSTTTYSFTINESKVYSVRFYAPYAAPAGTRITGTKIQINRGLEAMPYRPYFESVFSIPESVRVADGLDNEFHDSIRYIYGEGFKKIKKVLRIVLDGTESWAAYTSSQDGYYTYYFDLTKNSAPPSSNTVLCNLFDYVSYGYTSSVSGRCVSVDSSGTAMFFKMNDYATVSAWKGRVAELYAEGTPLTVVYALRDEEITDISNYMSRDNYIAVESGGIIIMENEKKYDAPSEIEYQLGV